MPISPRSRPSTGSATATAKGDAGGMARGDEEHAAGRVLSPITRRILAVNLLALAILVAGLLSLGQYRRSLIEAELAALAIHAAMTAAALGEGAVSPADALGPRLVQEAGRRIIRRMVETTGSRVRVFDLSGRLVADSRRLLGPGGMVEMKELPPPSGGALGVVLDLYDKVAAWLPGEDDLPPYREAAVQRAMHYAEVVKALSGEHAAEVRSIRPKGMVLSVAVPVQRYKRVLGALMLSKDSRDIDATLLQVRLRILEVFAVALGVTVLLSLYLARTIARPIRRLAAAAERVRHGLHREHEIPDLAGRDDEIGDLATTLRHMTEALWQRLDAIEAFAADVAHEIKNPLTSLRSAVETAARIRDPERRRRLMSIVEDDVQRLDRLISDISDASRLDAELSRAAARRLDLAALLATLVDVHAATAAEGAPRLRLDLADGTDFTIGGIEGRLAQVFRNLLANAFSFSPADGSIGIRMTRQGGRIRIDVDDDGPGIAEGKEDAIFERFYSERPVREKFGTHSGLGLSICRQIVGAHGGTITACNRRAADGRVAGARFTVSLPAAGGS